MPLFVVALWHRAGSYTDRRSPSGGQHQRHLKSLKGFLAPIFPLSFTGTLQTLLLAIFGQLQILVDPYTDFEKATVGVRALQ